ncbi:MAG: hypothetical protein ACPH09_09940 [Pseudomonadales bacterium]
MLNAAGNKLTTLPDGISKCEKLKEVNLEDNPLTHLAKRRQTGFGALRNEH